MRNHGIYRNEGMALLLATFLVFIAVMTLGALSVRVVNQSRHTDQYVSYEQSMCGIETGLAQCQASLEQGSGGMIGVSPSLGTGDGPRRYDFGDEGVSPLTLADMPSVQYFAYAENWGNDGVDNNGDGTIDGPEEQWYFSMFSNARDVSITRRAEVVVKAVDVNVWRNAIFAGGGQAGGLINGNVSIHGSVHLLGDNIIPGGEAITAIDLSGTSLIHNNYNGMPADLLGRVPPLVQRLYGGEQVSTLDAKLRVRSGLVGLSGNSEIGEPNIVGNGSKETMDGTYVSQGWTGTAVVDDGGRGDPKSVYSDNGWDTGYDLGTKVPLPMLDDDWRDPITGARVWDSARGDWYTHRNYFTEVLVGSPTNPTDGIYQGNLTISANSNFYYNASRPSDANPANRQATDDYILFNAATNKLEMNGQIAINGSLTFTRGGGNDKTINYTGRAAILASGDITVDTDMLTVNANGTTTGSFPQNNILGLMASGNLMVGSLSQLSLMGAFYAQNTVKSTKQTNTAGTFVGNYFDMGTNVPSIFQVPTLADNLPYGMIGYYPILAFLQVSWRELGA